MSELIADSLKVNDLISVESTAGRGPIKLKGIISRIQDYNFYDGNNEYITGKYLQVLTLEGMKSTYFKLTDKIIKEIVTPENELDLVIRPMIRSLPRVVESQGSDPEIFVVNKNNEVIPAFDFLGSKEKPTKFKHISTSMFWDGFQAEFNIPAQTCLDATVSNFFYGLKELDEAAKKHNPDARLTIQTTFDIPPHIIDQAKPEHVAFGCMPSFNVYDMKGIQAEGKDVFFRSTGGHIHLQLTSTQKKKIPEYVKALDAILGVASVSMFGNIDDARRREYYGLAGEYRTPKHGMEYRTLSNAWLCDPTVTYITYELARKVISLVDRDLFKHWVYNESDVIDCINTCNIPLACEIIKQNEVMFKDILFSFCYNDDKLATAVYNIFMHGVENLVDNVDDIYSNWKLNSYNPHNGNARIQNLVNKDVYKKLLKLG